MSNIERFPEQTGPEQYAPVGQRPPKKLSNIDQAADALETPSGTHRASKEATRMIPPMIRPLKM